MAIFKCKMCGGTIEFNPGETIGECDSCGTKQTLPKTTDETVANLFNRANILRLKCEFDKAAQIYEKIVQQYDSEAEAHWGLVLCKYGIEYVEDPKDGRRVPTCHRTLYNAVTTDADYTAAIDYSDTYQQSIYEQEARAIDRIQKDILAVVKNEKPFDVFICYKETDENGRRTQDSALANDIYYQLTQEGFKVFYAAITLEDKLGQEYEPYIYAALQSAKVMLVVGTKPEYFNAVWVRNEWSRFLSFMKTDRSKLLIPCYRDMDAYELPEEFAHLQAQDMSKIGFVNDVVRGIKKVFDSDKPKETKKGSVKDTVVVSGEAASAARIETVLKRIFIFLGDGDWKSANVYCEKILDQDPENARAYLGKLMAELRVRKQENLKDVSEPFEDSVIYQKIMQFGDDALISELTEDNQFIRERQYRAAKEIMQNNDEKDEVIRAARIFNNLKNYRDSPELAEKCNTIVKIYKSKEEAKALDSKILQYEQQLEVSKKNAEKQKNILNNLEKEEEKKKKNARKCLRWFKIASIFAVFDLFTLFFLGNSILSVIIYIPKMIFHISFNIGKKYSKKCGAGNDGMMSLFLQNLFLFLFGYNINGEEAGALPMLLCFLFVIIFLCSFFKFTSEEIRIAKMIIEQDNIKGEYIKMSTYEMEIIQYQSIISDLEKQKDEQDKAIKILQSS